MKLIGINGFKTSGKDTAYSAIKSIVEGPLIANPSERVERRAFADKIKIMSGLCLGFDRSEDDLIALMDSFKEGAAINILYREPGEHPLPWEDTATMTHLSGRQFLQYFGAHARAVFGEDFWVDQVLPKDQVSIEKIWRTIGRNGAIAGMPAYGCITDVRYPNEAQRVLESSGTVIEIVRPDCESDGHSSERPLPRDLVSYTVYNDGTLEKLYRALQEVVEAL